MPRGYRLSDFDYELPSSHIAQHPLPDRTASRLLVLDRAGGAIRHLRFGDLAGVIPAGDVLVLNTSKVIPARLHGRRETGAAAEILLVRALPDGTWLALGHPGGKLKPGRRVTFGADSAVEVVERLGGGLRRVRFVGALDAHATLAQYGEVPLPPYIRRPPSREDRDRYQTVYAEHEGSVAAPTAGLHFSPPLLDHLRARGVAIAGLDLHVGPGTFKPVDQEDLTRHPMHPEPFSIPPGAAALINEGRGAGRHIWAVGTTVVRALESAVERDGRVSPADGETALFIYPPYRFQAVDRLLTNFHLPRSTLLMLVCAFGGYEVVMRAYREAVRAGYRFYSYGDAMLVV
ncbi:MAG: tRNA preQ1(34) S-adenosylmethionine ribosyltransferase-isomerase QueA [Gemmatimonadales bacterium]